MQTFEEEHGEAPQLGDIWRHRAIENLDCVSGSWDTETIVKGPFLYTSPDGWQLLEARFSETHKRGDAGIQEWRMMTKGTNVATNISLESAHEAALSLLAKMLSDSQANKDEKARVENEIKFELSDKYRNILNSTSSSSSNVDSVEFRIFARGLGRTSGSRSRVQGFLEVAERFIGTRESIESQLKDIVTNGVQKLR